MIIAERNAEDLAKLGQVRASIEWKSKSVSARDKQRWDAKIKPLTLEIGDHGRMRKESKLGLEPNWLGPYVVVDRNLETHIYKLEHVLGEPYDSWVHVDRLRKMDPYSIDTPFYSPASTRANWIEENGLPPDEPYTPDKKIIAIQEWPTPTTTTAVRSFIGMASCYRRFIKDFAHIVAPLNDLTKGKKAKNEEINWSVQCEEAFQTIKRKLTEAPILQVYDPEKPVVLETDASQFAIGATLLQPVQDETDLRPVAYFSRKMNPAETRYATNERELLAIVKALREWRCYVEVLTDRGSNFTSGYVKDFLVAIQCKHLTATAYRPKSMAYVNG